MIVSALVKRYEDTLIVPTGWQERNVSYALNIDESGNLLGIVSLETQNEKKTVRRKLTLPMEPPGRTSGIKAAFLCDNGGYVLGLDSKRGAEKFKAAHDLHVKLLKNINTCAAKAILAFFKSGITVNVAELIDIEAAAKAIFVFQVEGKFIDYSDVDMRKAWDEWYRMQSTKPTICLVTGRLDTPEATHSTVKLRGGQSSGSYLISANKDSFTSYGKTAKDRAADVGKYAAFAYVTALNALLSDNKHYRLISGNTLAFWAEKGGEAEEELFTNLLDPPRADEDNKLADVMYRVSRGNKAQDPSLKQKFYLLCLSPNAARISVRFFYQCEFGDLINNIQKHYDRLNIVGDGRTPYSLLPLWMILSETTVKKSASDATPLLGGQLLQCILTGTDYPINLYQAISIRIRAGEAINQTKASIIKAILIKNFNESEVTTVALNEQSLCQPYVLGRLFSVLERLQEKANGSSTIQARYFSSACTNPGSVFPTLLRLSIHHAAKLDNAVFFEKLKTDLLGRLDDTAPFPSILSLDDQGRFILGYYHQTQSFFTKKEKMEGSNDE